MQDLRMRMRKSPGTPPAQDELKNCAIQFLRLMEPVKLTPGSIPKKRDLGKLLPNRGCVKKVVRNGDVVPMEESTHIVSPC